MEKVIRVTDVVALACCLVVASAGTSAFAQVATPVGPTFTVLSATQSLTTDVAYDPAHNLYLVVAGRGFGMLRGSFVTTTGTVLSTFPIADPVGGVDGYWEAPRVSYCPDYSAFLIVWTNGYPISNSNLWARGIAANPDGSPNYLTPQFQVETGIVMTQAPSVAYSPVSREFLVAYTMQGTFELRARRISLISGTSGPIILGGPAEYATVAYNSVANEFLVACRYEPDVSADIEAVRIQPVTGAVLGGAISISGLTSNLLSQPDIQFDPSTNRYFVTWWQQTGGGMTFGRFLNADGSDAGLHSLAQGVGSYDCIANARNPVDGTYFLTACHPVVPEVFGVRVNADGSVTEPLIQVTSSGASSGAFGNRVAANGGQAGWLVTAAIDQAHVAAQLVGVR